MINQTSFGMYQQQNVQYVDGQPYIVSTLHPINRLNLNIYPILNNEKWLDNINTIE